MGWSRINHDIYSAGGSTGGSTTPGVNTSGGDLAIIVNCSYAGGTQSTPTDAFSNVYVGLTVKDGGIETRLKTWYAKNAAVGSNHTITVGATSNYYGTAILEVWSGSDLTAPFDKEKNATGAAVSTLATGNTANLTADDELCIVGVCMDGSGVTVSTIDTSFTVGDQHAYQAGVAEGGGAGYKTLTGGNGSPISATFNMSGSSADITVNISTFKQAAGGGGGLVGPLIRGGMLTHGSLIRGGRLAA